MASASLVLDGDVSIPAEAFDLAGFRRWVHSPEFCERGRFSYLAGEFYVDMAAEEIHTHNVVKLAVTADLRAWTRPRNLGKLLADRAFYVNRPVDLATEPDLMFVAWDTLRSGQARLVEVVEGSGRFLEVQGAVDLTVEIVSDSSVRKDTQRLLDLYFAAGVGEYWLIDARGEDVSFKLFVRGDGGFVERAPDAEGYRHSDVLQGKFALNREVDPVGGFEYVLHARRAN